MHEDKTKDFFKAQNKMKSRVKSRSKLKKGLHRKNKVESKSKSKGGIKIKHKVKRSKRGTGTGDGGSLNVLDKGKGNPKVDTNLKTKVKTNNKAASGGGLSALIAALDKADR